MIELLPLWRNFGAKQEGAAESGQCSEGTGDGDQDPYAAVWESFVQPSPEAIAAARRRREVAEGLFEELMHAAPARRSAVIRTPHFRSLDLLDLLVEASHARQLANPVQGDELARLAVRLAGLFGEGEGDASAALTVAFCLGANARRLRADHLGAESLLARGAPTLAFPSEKALFSRMAGLLRWEQGRTTEAEALLGHAARLYASEELEGEVSACLMLLGLLKWEQVGPRGDALPLLARGWEALDRDLRPLLALRGGLALVECLAHAGHRERAGCLMRTCRGLLSQVTTDPAESLRLRWLEARALNSLGDAATAVCELESVWRQLIAEPCPAEAALVALDLALVLAESGRSVEIESLPRALQNCFPDWSALPRVMACLLRFEELAGQGEPYLREATVLLSETLRRHLRASQARIKPLPFV